MSNANNGKVRWLLMIHQLPAKPAYGRVKVGRKLQALGAIAVKNAVHALPVNAATVPAFRTLAAEIVESGGEAFVCESRFTDGLTDAEVRQLFDASRDADYDELIAEAQALLKATELSATDVRRIRRRREEISKIDFFGARGRQGADVALADLDRRLMRHEDVSRRDAAPRLKRSQLKKRTWVTRRDVHIDRIASAWLIQRFIDPAGIIKFVDSKTYKPVTGELRFDMANAEYTHEGDRCTFETLLRHAGLESNPALRAIGEIVHDLDIEDGRYERPETAGLAAMISGVCAAAKSDDQRIKLCSASLDQFYAHFKKA